MKREKREKGKENEDFFSWNNKEINNVEANLCGKSTLDAT